MKFNIVLLIILATFLFLSGCNLLKQEQKTDQIGKGAQTTPPSTTKSYSHFENPFYNIEYPQGWEERDSGDAVMFLSPLADEFDNYRENIIIQSASAGDSTLEEAFESYINGIRGSAEEFTIINYSSATLVGLPAYNLEYKVKIKDQNLRSLAVFTIKDKYAYIVTYFALERDYDKYLDDAKHAISSFKIVEYAPTPVPEINAAGELVSGEWRVYSSSVYYDTGVSDFLETPSDLLEVKADYTWTFGSKSGTWSISDITDDDWKKWGISPYSPTKKIILYNWNNDSVDGPIEESASTVRAGNIWIMYRSGPPEISQPAQIQMKFVWSVE